LKHSKNVTIFGISVLAALLMVGLVANQAMAVPTTKVAICHVVDNPDVTLTIANDKSLIKGHLKHGDHLGVCNYCGDGSLDDQEICDDGNTSNTDACTNVCASAACGDNYIQTSNSETCDDGNTDNGDGCDSTCQIETEYCGDGIVNGSEECDGSNLDGQECLDVTFLDGILDCNVDCTFDTSGCTID
jgi:cysteine-rich repeat protein